MSDKCLRLFGSNIPYAISLEMMWKIIAIDDIGVIQLYRTTPSKLNREYQHMPSDIAKFVKSSESQPSISVYIHSTFPATITGKNPYKIMSLIYDVRYAAAFTTAKNLGIVIHPGRNIEGARKSILTNLQTIIRKTRKNPATSRVRLLLENTAKTGRSSAILETVDDIIALNTYLRANMDANDYKRIGFCIDLCHIYVTMRTLRLDINFYSFFAKLVKNKVPIGLIHLNDSQSDVQDRHANLFSGNIPPIEMIYAIKFILANGIDSVIERMPCEHDTDSDAYKYYCREISPMFNVLRKVIAEIVKKKY